MRRRLRWRERLAPLLVLGIVLGVLSGGSVLAHAAGPFTPAGTTGAEATRTEAAPAPPRGPARVELIPARDPAPAAGSPASGGLDLADLRHGNAQRADSSRAPAGPGHADAAVVGAWPPPHSESAHTGPPPGAVRPVLDVVAPRLSRAPPSFE